MKPTSRAKSTCCPSTWTKVARLHLKKLGVNLTTLRADQADYISVPVEGPYKPNHYRY